MDSERILQADEYSFPYHYLPVPGPDCRLTRSWNFAPSYLAALDLVGAWMKEQFSSVPQSANWEHVDIGCGDGALIYHLSNNEGIRHNFKFSGVDYDERAIEWARMFNPSINLFSGDVGSLEAGKYNSASLVEVAEHIPPDQLRDFIRKCAGLLQPNGKMVITVPSISKPISPKHYQHFSADLIKKYFSEHFDIVSISGFERNNLMSRILARLAYRHSARIDFPMINRYLVSTLGRTYTRIDGCGRLFAVLSKKA